MNPDKVIWEGKAEALSSVNAAGPFDILPSHANFVTLIKDTDVVLHLEGGKEHKLSFESAVLFFHEDIAKIYVHISKSVSNPGEDKE